jgi:FAT domain/Phosphatidylinositol 3- and 4-kinase
VPTAPVSAQAAAASQARGDVDDFRPNAHMADVTANFLAQVPFRPMDRREGRVIADRCIRLVETSIKLWPDNPVRLSFLEKIFDNAVVDRAGTAGVNVVGRSKGSGNTNVTSGDSKGPSAAITKAEALKAEKMDALAGERVAVRASALAVALKLSLVLIDNQGERFIRLNVGAIRAMVGPSIADHNLTSASLFAQLLSRLLATCPPTKSRVQLHETGNVASGVNRTEGSIRSEVMASASTSLANGGHRGVALTAVPGATVGIGQQGPASRVAKGPSSAATVGESDAEHTAVPAGVIPTPSGQVSMTGIDEIYTVVESHIERCLKADMISVHCGLIVLSALVEKLPNEFVRYQDLVVKALHRMAKESLSTTHPPGVSGSANAPGGASAGNPREVASGAVSSSGAVRGAGGVANDCGSDGSAPHGGRDGTNGGSSIASAAGRGSGGGSGELSSDGQALIAGLSLCGTHATSLEPQQKRAFYQVLWVLIDRCVLVKVLLEIVRIVDKWVQWRPPRPDQKLPMGSILAKEPLPPKDMVTVLTRMVVFERITGQGSEQLMSSYLNIVLGVFGGGERSERRPELLYKLERAFMIGLKTPTAAIRAKFFALFDAAADRSPVERLRYSIAQQNWEPLSDSFWIRQALELLLAVVEPKNRICSDTSTARLPGIQPNAGSSAKCDGDIAMGSGVAGSEEADKPRRYLVGFLSTIQRLRSGDFIASLRDLIHVDSELAHAAWVCIFPHVWKMIPASEKPVMEAALSNMFAKEYHVVQAAWPRNVIQALLDAASRCDPAPPLRPEILLHVGMRWNAWHLALPYLERRDRALRETLARVTTLGDKRLLARTEAELESVLDAISEMYRLLHERDMFAGVWKVRCKAPSTTVALCMEQQARFSEAQAQYAKLNITYSSNIEAGTFASNSLGHCMRSASEHVGKAEVCLWEERFVECARELCQWDVLTEFSRSCVHTDLLHECLWRVPEWSALKELLLKHPVEDGPRLKIFQSYVQLQENKLEVADNYVQQGMHRALEMYCALPMGSSPQATAPLLVQFQQLVELQESSRILAELNALSRHGSVNTNVEQHIETVKLILNSWRERLPAPQESLTVWSDVLTWRNHVHSIVVNVLEALKEAANQTVQASHAGNVVSVGSSKSGTAGGSGGAVPHAQVQAAQAIVTALSQQQALIMGVNETAWSVHRFARACRKQGLPNVALNALQKLYPFDTMELTEYFVKTKETAKAYMACPSGLDNGILHGLNALNQFNMDHFSAQQKAELFAMKGRFLQALGRDDDVAEALSTALSTARDVSSAWLSWAKHSDAMHVKEAGRASQGQPPSARELIWREAAANCFMNAITYGSRTGRSFLPRALRLLTLDLAARQRLLLAGGQSTNDKTSDALEDATSASTPRDSTFHTLSPDSAIDGGREQGVFGVFMASVDSVPAWVWLPWMSQLVPMLARSEVVVAEAILSRVAQQYPQAAFFPLRAFLEERKPVDRPSRFLVAEALRTSRPNTAPLLPAAASAQLGTAAKQLSNAHTIAQTAKQRQNMLVAAHAKAAAEAHAKMGTPEHHALLARVNALSEDVGNAHKGFERAMRAYNSAFAQKKSAALQVEAANQQVSAANSLAVCNRGTSGVSRAATEAGVVAGIASTAPPASSTNPSATVSTMGTVVAGPSDAGVIDSIPSAPSRGHLSGQPAPVSTSTSSVTSLAAGAGTSVFPNSASLVAQGVAVPVGASDTPAQSGADAEAVGSSAALGESPADGSRTSAQAHQAHAHAQAQAAAVAHQHISNMVPSTPYEHADVVMARLVKAHQGLYLEIERIAIDLAQRMKPQQEEQLLGLMNALLHRCYQLSVQVGKEVAPSLRSALEEVSRMCFGTGQMQASGPGGQQGVKIQPSIADLKSAFEAELAPQTAVDFPMKIEPFIGRLRRWKNIFQRRVDAMPEFQRLELLSRHLIEAHNLDVEVFGQYLMAEATEPSPQTHIKIGRFSADTRVVRRHSGAARGVTIVGSNGRMYHFLLETSVNAASQPTEERAAQLCRLLNASIFARDAEASRRRIRIDVTTLVPTGQHTRLVSDDPSYSSLAEGLERHMESSGGSMDDPLMAFRNLAAEAYKRRHVQNTPQSAGGGRKDSIAARVDAYLAVCEQHIPDTCLSDWIALSIPYASMHFAFRKKFTEMLGTASIVSYALAIGARRPQNVLFSWSTGAVSNLHMRPLVSQRGLLECDEAVPFRLTRNLQRLIGPNGMHGPLFGSMAATMRALRSNDELLSVYLNSIVRDELSAWAMSRPDSACARGAASGRRQQEQSLIEFDVLEERLAESVRNIFRRLTPVTEPPSATSNGGFRSSKAVANMPVGAELDDVTRTVYVLIDRAGRPEHLAQMDASWQAWF